ncbi:hypothetical protein GCM10009530_47400 [Microbispora corallina]|uniref:MFS transporter n=1 Tax=Microbispora corallina TaxID=83302 RepID=A0ABQ4G5F4_9ACTN|nr:hypothetical protein Mco01_53150 [Microbispora corallina]
MPGFPADRAKARRGSPEPRQDGATRQDAPEPGQDRADGRREPPEPRRDRAERRGVPGIVRYLAAAVLVRTADGGAAVGLVLLALDPALRLRDAAATGGLLAAALSAPHLIGPWAAHRLDRSRDSRRILAVAYVLYGAGLAAGSLALGRAPLVTAVALVAVAGACGPLLTGGLSSRLGGIVGPSVREQRRAQGWDSLTYGIAGTAGPGVVAAFAGLLGPLPALLGLSCAAAAAALLTWTLPHDGRGRPAEEETPGVLAGMAVMARIGPLRRVTLLTLLSAPQIGALPVIAAVLAPHLTHRPGAAATLTVAAGLGSLAGSLVVTVFPLRGEPETLALRLFAVTAAATALCALAPAYPLALAGFAAIGAANAVSFTATLAARQAYAPPGARAQVFVTSAGLKVALASVGSATAGAAAGLGGNALLLLTAALFGVAVLAAAGDLALTGGRRAGRRAARRPAPDQASPPERSPSACS